MHEKPKKSKDRIPQWQFLLAWISGQYVGFYTTVFMGFAVLLALNNIAEFASVTPALLQFLIVGAGLGWFSGWVQQWSIRKYTGHFIKGWKTVSSILTAISFATVIPFVMYLAQTHLYLFDNNSPTLIALVAGTFMAIFGAAGLGQSILLRKHVKNSWLFFLSTLVSGLMFGLPVLGNSTYIVAQIAQFSVTAFAIIWLFGMSGNMDALQNSAIQRLSDTDSEAIEDEEQDTQQKRQSGKNSLFQGLWTTLKRSFAS